VPNIPRIPLRIDDEIRFFVHDAPFQALQLPLPGSWFSGIYTGVADEMLDSLSRKPWAVALGTLT
jgi:hypothetical protein